MRYDYKFKSPFEKFALEVYEIITNDFPQTFFTGGMVRDILLKKKVTDIDIATNAKPNQLIKLLKKFSLDTKHQQFGVIIVKNNRRQIEITTFRKDSYRGTRYPKISFTNSARVDSQRRDFTINSLYFSPKTGTILDPQKGLKDLNQKLVRFIGDPVQRIKEDPLRIVRAYRFTTTLNFKLETQSRKAIENNLNLLTKLTKTKLQTEINKISSTKHRKIVQKVIHIIA